MNKFMSDKAKANKQEYDTKYQKQNNKRKDEQIEKISAQVGFIK